MDKVEEICRAHLEFCKKRERENRKFLNNPKNWR